MSETKVYQLDEWRAEAVKRFGPDSKNWKYKCSNCGHEQTINDFIKAGIKEPENKVFYSCIGRWTGAEGTINNEKSPCNYTLGGLFKITNVSVIDEEGKKHWVFDFAEPDKKEAAPVAPFASLVTILLLLFLSACSPSRITPCPGSVTKINGDTVPEWMHISTRAKGFVFAQVALSVRVNGMCATHLDCDKKPFPVHYHVGWCQGREQLFNRLVSQLK